MNSGKLQYAYQDEFTLRDLISALWRAKWMMLALSVGFASLTTIAALVMPKKYETSITIAPVSEAPGNGQLAALGSFAAQFGGLASLAGLPVSGDSRKVESIAVLQSQALTGEYIRKNKLLPVLYSDLWDAKNTRWNVTDQRQIPTIWKANEKFKKIRTISTDSRTGLVTLTIAWTDPAIAADWANDLVRMTNDYLRRKAIEESERNIAYLTEQAAKTDLIGAKQAIYSILQTEINRAMLARGSEEYALKIIDPAVPPEAPSSPNILLWGLAGLFGGFSSSMLIVFVSLAWRKSTPIAAPAKRPARVPNPVE